jgi:hypothetical protein
MVRHVVKSCLPAPIVGWKKHKRGLLPGLVFFRLVAPPLQPGVVGLYPVQGVWHPRNQSYPKFWVVTGDPRYLTPTELDSKSQLLQVLHSV